MRAFIGSNLPIYLNVTSDPDTRISLEEFYVDLVRNHDLYLERIKSSDMPMMRPAYRAKWVFSRGHSPNCSGLL